MRALILAAGSGERLRPLTADRPKPMIEIGGKPVLQHNIELLVRAGIREAVVNLHHRGEAVTEYFGDGSSFGIELTYAYEPKLLGTAGAVANVAPYLGEADFIVVYGDNLSTIDLCRLIQTHRIKSADLTLALYHRDLPSAAGIAEIDADDRIRRFVEKPRPDQIFSRWVNAGYLVAKPSTAALIPTEGPSDIGRDLIPALLSSGAHVYGYRMSEMLWWIDAPPDYARTKAAFEAQRLS